MPELQLICQGHCRLIILVASRGRRDPGQYLALGDFQVFFDPCGLSGLQIFPELGKRQALGYVP